MAIQPTSKIALITGAHGFIGKHLARLLSASGYRVCGLGHGMWPEAEATSCGVSQWLNGDIVPSNLRYLQQSFGTPDVVYHLAGGSAVGVAIANPREDFFRTVATTAELLDWIRLDVPSTHLVAVSSAAVYGAGHTGHIPENRTLNPFSPYGHHKRLMEELCRSYAASYGMSIAIVRLFSVYGNELRKQLLWDLCSRLATGVDPLTMGGTGEELRDWTDVRDVVRALALVADTASAAVPVVNVGTGIATSVRDVATMLAKQWPTVNNQIALSFNGQARKGDPFSLLAEPSRLRDLGFEWKVPVSQGIADYVRWYCTERLATK